MLKNIVVETADAEIKAAGVEMKYEVGTMIEIPRAALLLTRSLKRLSSSASVQTT